VPYIAKDKKRVLLFSVVNDKNFDEMARIIAESGQFEHVFVTQLEGHRRLDAEVIKKAFLDNGIYNVNVSESLEAAWEAALEAAEPDGVLFVSGSLYLVGDICRLCGGYDDRF
jgi:dihydrofolate synthase/folylpolyglutamate synthase